ncbi:hypothetical protein G4E03_003468 [Salmonella enterica]|nr:hypothetical protein [Salmonella enterica]
MSNDERLKNLTNMGKGRPKGALNKSTRERLNQWRNLLDETNISGKNMGLLLERIEEGSIKSSDAIALQKLINEYAFRKVDDEILDEIIPTTPEQDAEKIKDLLQIAAALRSK